MFSFQNDVAFHRFNAAAGICLQEALPVSTQQSAVWATSLFSVFTVFELLAPAGGGFERFLILIIFCSPFYFVFELLRGVALADRPLNLVLYMSSATTKIRF
jgi:hypothetical protein